MKYGFKALLAGVALLGAAAGFTSGAIAADGKLVAVTHGQANDPFWSVVKNGVTAAAKDMNITVDYRAPETFDMVAMSQLIDAAVNQKPAGIIVSIPDASALGPAIKKAVAAGIPVISINSGSDVSKELGALLHVGQDEYSAGKAAGEKLKQLGGKKGICVNQEVGNVSLDLRCKGFALSPEWHCRSRSAPPVETVLPARIGAIPEAHSGKRPEAPGGARMPAPAAA